MSNRKKAMIACMLKDQSYLDEAKRILLKANIDVVLTTSDKNCSNNNLPHDYLEQQLNDHGLSKDDILAIIISHGWDDYLWLNTLITLCTYRGMKIICIFIPNVTDSDTPACIERISVTGIPWVEEIIVEALEGIIMGWHDPVTGEPTNVSWHLPRHICQ